MAILLSGAALLLFSGRTLMSGSADFRPKHAVGGPPETVLAVTEPFWFYGLVVGLTILGLYLVMLGLRMIINR